MFIRHPFAPTLQAGSGTNPTSPVPTPEAAVPAAGKAHGTPTPPTPEVGAQAGPGTSSVPAGGKGAEDEPGGAGSAAVERDRGHHNEVVVIGRITAVPTVRELPSGDRLVSWRIGVARPRSLERPGHRLDSLTLVSFDEKFVERVRGWRMGSVIRVTGSLRRRIWRGSQGVRSVLEVEVATAEPVAKERG